MANHLAGKGINERLRKAAIRAIKQADAGIHKGHKSVQVLMQEFMQEDFPGWLAMMIKLDPSVLRLDVDISITGAIDQARERIINGQVIEHAAPALANQAQVIDYTSVPEPAPAKDAASD